MCTGSLDINLECSCSLILLPGEENLMSPVERLITSYDVAAAAYHTGVAVTSHSAQISSSLCILILVDEIAVRT